MAEKRQERPEKERRVPTLKGICVIIVLLAVYILFNLLGAYIFVLLEKQPAEELKPPHAFAEIKQNFVQNYNGCLTTQDLDDFLLVINVHVVTSSNW